MKQHIYKLTGKIQHYVWGGKNYIPDLLNITKQHEQYYAEWWLGAHPSAPSTLIMNHEEKSLLEFLSENPTTLGQESIHKFGTELPYLLKILDVEKPLSIQLHPTKEQAEVGFNLENEKGILLSDPKRTYKDKNHKPEMMIALSDFWLLHGFKTKDEILKTLYSHPSLVDLANKLEKSNLQNVYTHIMQANQRELAQWLLPIIETNQLAYKNNQLLLSDPDYWVLYTIEEMNISLDKLDAGLLCFYLFNIVHLKKGEGIYQDAGIPHAYLRGQNIELMAASDNVIRGGLTPKHVDINALLEIIDYTEVIPNIIKPAPTSGVFTYNTIAKDFALENINYLKNEYCSLQAKNAEILLVMNGEIALSTEKESLILKQGESAFICANTIYKIKGIKTGYSVIAKLP